MSDLITWEVCPRCGGRAAVGWRIADPPAGGPQPGFPLVGTADEFDCTSGCRPTCRELAPLLAARSPHLRASVAVPPPGG
jgi:hypothetical protein